MQRKITLWHLIVGEGIIRMGVDILAKKAYMGGLLIDGGGGSMLDRQYGDSNYFKIIAVNC